MEQETIKAIKVLKQGGIVIFPTDTAFGIGCRIDNVQAVRKLFSIRKRPPDQAVPVLVNSIKMAQEYLTAIDQEVKKKLIKPFWPGALTIVLPCNVLKVSALVRGGGKSLGVRMPDNATTTALIRELGVPLLGPSANFSGGKTPYNFEELDQKLIKLADFVVSGSTKIKETSTVIDCTQKPWKILRQGAVKIQI